MNCGKMDCYIKEPHQHGTTTVNAMGCISGCHDPGDECDKVKALLLQNEELQKEVDRLGFLERERYRQREQAKSEKDAAERLLGEIHAWALTEQAKATDEQEKCRSTENIGRWHGRRFALMELIEKIAIKPKCESDSPSAAELKIYREVGEFLEGKTEKRKDEGNYRCRTCGWVATKESRPLSRGTKVGCPKCLGDADYV